MLVQFIYNNCDLILVQSKVFIDAIVKTGINNKKIKYFPNSAEEIFSHSQAMSELPENVKLPKGFRVMFAGNIGAAQDFETILSAAELLKKQKDIHWVIVGDGRMLPWVKEQIIKRQLSSNVHLLGRHPLQSMPAFFAQADVMLVTLRRELIFALTIPGKVQSYMAAGRPVIAALDGEGARVIEEAKAGFACPAESPDALANTVLKVYHMNPAEREQIASRGKEYFEQNFERNKLLDALENYLADLKVIKDKRCEL
jgi:glycosyltransferase involved in cell wall biosynthesis